MSEVDQLVYESVPDVPYLGYYEGGSPVLMLKDPDLIKQITIKHFDNFSERRVVGELDKAEPLFGKMITSAKGEKWKNIRSIMSPSFSSGKLKGMTTLLHNVAVNLKKLLLEKAEKQEEIEGKEVFGSYSIDSVASCAFGLETGSLTGNSTFADMARKFSELPNMFVILMFFVCPWALNWFRISIVNPVTIKYFTKVIKDTMKYRKETDAKRNDFIQLMLTAQQHGADDVVEDEETKLNHKVDAKHVLDDDTIVANSVIFIVAGHDTTSTLLSFTALMLAKHPDIQDRLIQEIKEKSQLHGGVNYQAVKEMDYLHMVIQEVQRMYPPATRIERTCSKPFQLTSELTIPADLTINIPVWSIHHDDKFYPEPEKFDPERFSKENKNNRHPQTFMTFGAGPRNCVGLRFANIMAEVCLAEILQEVKFVVGEKTPHEIKLDPKHKMLCAKGGSWVKVEKHDQ